MKKTKLKLVYLEWADALTNSGGWRTFSEVKLWGRGSDWFICETGYLIEETKEYLVIAQGMKPEDEFTEQQFVNLHKIPKTWIRKRKELKV